MFLDIALHGPEQETSGTFEILTSYAMSALCSLQVLSWDVRQFALSISEGYSANEFIEHDSAISLKALWLGRSQALGVFLFPQEIGERHPAKQHPP
jgi:hypothetical protein